MTHDVWLMIMISLGVFVVTSVLWVVYGAHRVDVLRQVHAREVEGLKMEIASVNRMRIDG